MKLPCSDLRILDFGQGYSSIPGMIFADYGAEVLKVEPPEGESFRSMPAFLQWNRGKKGVVLDLKTDLGREQAQALATTCDVVVESFRPGVADRLGIGYELLSSRNPGLVYLSISGFEPRSKYRDYKGYEGIVAAKCGQYAIQNGYRDDGPIYDAVFKCSYGAAILGLIGALAALHVRDRTGVGQKVESTLVRANFVYSYGGVRSDNPSPSIKLSQVQPRDPHNDMPGYRIAQCADGKWIQSGSAGGRIFENLMRALGIEEFFTDPRYRGFKPGQVEYDLLRRMDETYKTKPLDEWVRILGEHDAAFGVMMTTQEFMDYPQVLHNGHVIDVVDPAVGRVKQIGPLVTFGNGPWQWPGPAPQLGEHTAELHSLVKERRVAEREPKDTGPLPPSALNGITILDLSMWAAAPGGPGILADLGARVIKIEPPDGEPLPLSELFFRVNRGKERIAVDLKSSEGREILDALVAKADVLVHNFRPGVPERLGLDYASVVKRNPRLVYLYAASFGSTGPEARRPAFDAVISAMAGGEVLQGGEGNPPQMRQTTDHSSLLGVTAAMLLGLRARELTGEAQNIETTMLASAAYLFSDDFIRYDSKPPRSIPDAGQHGLHALYRLYRAKDSTWVFLVCVTEDEWLALCNSMAKPEWLQDSRLGSSADRRANDALLASLLEPLFLERKAQEWEAILRKQQVPCVVASDPWADFLFGAEVAGEKHFTTEFEWPGIGRIEQCGLPVHLTRTPGQPGTTDTLGGSTRAVLRELGYTEGRINELQAMGVIRLPEA